MAELSLVVIGLTLSSSWGNGHATTYRALLRGLARRGAEITFLERDVPWYCDHRDLPEPDFARLELYSGLGDLNARFGKLVRQADAVLIGSYVPDGVAVIDWALGTAKGPVVFYDIDTPITLAQLDGGKQDYLAKRQIPHFDLYLSFTGGPILNRLQKRYRARKARALYCTVDTANYRPRRNRNPIRHLGYLGTYSDDRQPALERLLIEPARLRPDLSFVVAGPQYPETIAWPPNVERIDHLPPGKHPRFYDSQRFTLNVTRARMIAAGWSPSVRLFEAAACGTPIISDRWDGLAELFPLGEAILIADTCEDVLGYLELPEAKRRAVGEAAREIVLTSHRAEVRAAQLETLLDQARGAKTAPPRQRARLRGYATIAGN